MADKQDRLTRTIARVAVASAVIVALALPGGFWALSYQYQVGAMRTEATYGATQVTQYIARSPAMWRFQTSRLTTFLEQDATEVNLPELRRILDTTGQLIATSSERTSLESPVLSFNAPLFDAGKIVGNFEVSRSLRPILLKTGLIALLALVLAAAAFGALKILPLRALNRALDRARQSDRLFSKAFHASPDPVMISRVEDGRILNVNTSFIRLTGYDTTDVIDHTHEDIQLWSATKDANGIKRSLSLNEANHNLEAILTTKAGEHRDMLISSEMIEVNHEHCVLTVARDITAQKATEKRMIYLANYDQLTGLPGRAMFRDRLKGAMKRASRTEHLVGLLYLDLDRFKQVNDSLGHQFGDHLLKQVADRLQHCLRSSDSVTSTTIRPNTHDDIPDITIARLGGDEFTIVLEDIKHIDEIARIAKRIISALSAPFDLDTRQVFIGASIGIAVYPFDDIDLDTLISNADAAMYRAKAVGRNNFQFYTSDLNANAEERLLLEAELHQALTLNQFELVYQPKLNLRSNLISGVEALLRWRSPRLGLVSPIDFIPLLEETGLIVPVGTWVLQKSCAQAAAWDRSGLDLTMAVNLSARQFFDGGLTDLVNATLHDTGLPASKLELEVTESLLMEDSDSSQTTLANIKRMGVKIAIDDFGTGYSSLAYLKRFPIDTLKIDRGFVKDIGLDSEDTAIVQAVIALARSLRLKVVAEGVETHQQLTFLRNTLCDYAQGYVISKPVSATALTHWMMEHHVGQLDSSGTPKHIQS